VSGRPPVPYVTMCGRRSRLSSGTGTSDDAAPRPAESTVTGTSVATVAPGFVHRPSRTAPSYE